MPGPTKRIVDDDDDDFLPAVDSKKKTRPSADKQREEVPVHSTSEFSPDVEMKSSVQPAQRTSSTIERIDHSERTLRLVDENVQKSQLDCSAQKNLEEVPVQTARRASITIGPTERIENSDQTKRRASLPLGFPTSKINLPAHPSSRVGLSRKSTTIKPLHRNLNPRVDSNENLS